MSEQTTGHKNNHNSQITTLTRTLHVQLSFTPADWLWDTSPDNDTKLLGPAMHHHIVKKRAN